MAGSKSNFLELELLDHVLGNGDASQNYTAPATVYLALYTVDPSDTGGGTEVSGNNYSRKSVTNNTTNFPAASGGSKTLNVETTFATPSGSWGTVTAVGVFDAATNGNLLYWAELSSDKTIGSGDTVKFNAGDLIFTED